MSRDIEIDGQRYKLPEGLPPKELWWLSKKGMADVCLGHNGIIKARCGDEPMNADQAEELGLHLLAAAKAARGGE